MHITTNQKSTTGTQNTGRNYLDLSCFEIHGTTNKQSLVDKQQKQNWDVILSDLKLLSKALVSKLHGSDRKIDISIKKQTESHQIQKLKKKQMKESNAKQI